MKTCHWETFDFGVACFLKAKGFRLLDIRKNGKDKAIFVFEERPDRKDLIVQYLNGEAMVNPLSFQYAIKELKSFTHNI